MILQQRAPGVLPSPVRGGLLVLFGAAILIHSGCRTTGSTATPRSARTNERSVRPGINDAYRDADVDQWIERFEGENREIYANRHRIVETIHVKPGMVIADVGSGTGFMTALLAKEVGPTGRVYAVDIVPGFLELIRTRAREQGLTNIKTVLCTEDSVALPPDSIELALLCDVYHHLEYPKSTMGSIYRALKPGGTLIVIDFKRIPDKSREWVLKHVRAEQATVLKELNEAGFELVDDETDADVLHENYIMRLRKVG